MSLAGKRRRKQTRATDENGLTDLSFVVQKLSENVSKIASILFDLPEQL